MAKIAFFQNISYPNLGVMCLSAVLKRGGHQVEVFVKNESTDERLAEEGLRSDPAIAAFSVCTGNHRWAERMATLLKRRSGGKVKVILGGPHPTFYPAAIEHPDVDAVCVGEGEAALAEYVAAADAGRSSAAVPNLWVKEEGRITRNEVRPLREDLDGLPFPDRALYFGKYPSLRSATLTVVAGRGCPFECSYCFNRSWKNIYRGKGPYVRWRSAENVVREIEECRKSYDVRAVYFQDDVFTLQPAFLKEFMPLYRDRVGLPFICLSRIELLTEETVRLLKDGGCQRIFWGIESGNEELRRTVLNRNIPNATIVQNAALLKKHGIPFRTYNMLGIPGETLQQAFETVELNQKIGTEYPWCSVLSPYPGTEIAEVFERRYGITLDLDQFGTTFFKDNQRRANGDYRRMQNLQKLFFWAVRYPRSFGVVKKLIGLRPNIMFDLLFLASYARGMWGSELLGAGDLLRRARYNIRNFFFSKTS